MIYGAKVLFLNAVDANISKGSLALIVNGTYDLTTGRKCGVTFPVWMNNKELLYSCGYAAKSVWLLSNLSSATINYCSVQLYAGYTFRIR